MSTALPPSPLAVPHQAVAGSAPARLEAVSRRTRDALIVRVLTSLAEELAFSPTMRGLGGSAQPAMGAILVAVDHLVRCVDDGAPAEVVAGRAAAISGSLAVADAL
ncbi:hypothetical protein [Frondihabitans australicus]|nr:hypothetical protein [Frondihabitans australicus]